MFTTNCGTDAFKAPELFASAADGWTRAVDVFSLGLVFFSLTQQRQPPRVPLSPLAGAHSLLCNNLSTLCAIVYMYAPSAMLAVISQMPD